MRVALISYHSFLKPGGVKRHIFGLHNEFKKRGIYSKIIAPRRSFKENYGKDVILLGTSFPLPFSGSVADLSINFNPWAIERILDKEKFDVLHFHNCGLPSSLQVLSRSQSLNVLTFHANIKGSDFLKKFPIVLYLLRKISQWKIHGVIGVAPLNLKVFKGYSGPKVVIPNGIDVKEFNPGVPKIGKFLDGKMNILFVGRIEERKGLIYLLKAYHILNKKYSDLRLIVVGEGELEKECKEWVKKHKLKEVYFESQRVGKVLPSYYNSCDIFVSPAIFGESFGLVLLEAMACAKPVVAFANQGYREFLENKKTGRFLVKPRDFKGLAEKIEILIKDPELRKKIGEWSFREAQNYSWQKIADRVLNFYRICQKYKKQKEK